MEKDGVDRIVEQWRQERPELDTTAMEVFGRIYRLASAAAGVADEAYGRFGIARADFDVLATLRRSGAPYELSPSALAGWMMLSSGGTTARLDRLEKAGLVARRPSDTDRRGVVVRLTDKGREIVDQAVGAGLSEQQRLLRHMEPAEVKRLSELLRKALRSS
jgi:DNA-binding MarR family transcriptional regulator